MKNISRIILFFLMSLQFVSAQTISPKVINSTGRTFQTSNGGIDFNIGESITGLISNSGNRITQGFLQPCSPTTSNQTEIACDSLIWNAQTYTTSGVYTYTTTNLEGCDSVVTLNLTINQSGQAPSLACYETATLNTITCSWDITGTQPIQPTLACWETATFNNTTCVWDVTGTQPVLPTLACWETATFNNTTCVWDITGTQPVQPTLACWETATFNNSTCVWDITGTQPVQPTLACWETATFNNTTCVWDVTGTQAPQPTLACWESATFNNTTCVWDVTGTQAPQPTLACWETATFNNTTCVWDVTGTQPVLPTLACWETATFNNTTCVWDVTGTQPVQPTLACWESALFNNITCVWDITGTQPVQPTLACWETATFNNSTCVWDITGTPIVVTATAGTITCFGGTTSVAVSATGGTGIFISGIGIFSGYVAGGPYYFSVTDNGGCNGISLALNISEPAKVQGTTTVTPANCGISNGSATVNASGGTGTYTYLWSDGQTTQTASGLAVGNYTVIISDGNGCSGTASALVNGVGLAPDPSGPIAGPSGVCRNQSGIVFSVAPVSGATNYSWTIPSGALGASTTNSITLSFDNSYSGGFICVTPSNTCGSSASACINIPVITIRPAQPGFIVGNPNPCGPNIITYSIPAIANALSYTWSVTGTGVVILSGQGSNSVQVSFPAGFGQAVLRVFASNCIGTTSTRSTTLTGIPAQSSALFGPAYVCAGASAVAYSISAAIGAGSSYAWTTSGDITPTGTQGTTSMTFDFGAGFTTGTINVTTSSLCGSFTKNYTIRSTAFQPGSIAGHGANLCGQTGVTYSIAPLTGATSYSWAVPSGVTITANTGTSITVNFESSFTGSGNICVSANNSCGPSIARCFLVTALPAVPTSIGGLASVCKTANSVSYTVSPVSWATHYSWYSSNGVILTTIGTGLSATADFRYSTSNSSTLTVRANNACGIGQPLNKVVAIDINCREAIAQVSDFENTRLYPNPSNGKITLNFFSEISEDYALRVIDIMGQTLISAQIKSIFGLNTKEIDLSSLARGVYMLGLQRNGNQEQLNRLVRE